MVDGNIDVPIGVSIAARKKKDVPISATLWAASSLNVPIQTSLYGTVSKNVPIQTSLITGRIDYGLYGVSTYDSVPRSTIFFAQGGTPDKLIAVTDPYWYIKSGDGESGTEGFMELGIGQNTMYTETDTNLTAFARVQQDADNAWVKIKPILWIQPTAEPAVDPETEQEGMMYYDSTAHDYLFWDGDSWELVGGGATGGLGGSGTQYTIPRFATTTSLGDSKIYENAGGTVVTVNADLTVTDGKIAFVNTGIHALMELEAYGSIGSTYAAGTLIVGHNASAHQTINQDPIVMTTHGTVGARAIKMKSGGFDFLAESGSVTAGNTLSTVVAALSDSGDFQMDGDLTIDGGDVIISSSTEQASLIINNPYNDANPYIQIGKDSNDRFFIQTLYNSGTQEIDTIQFQSVSTGGSANDGRMLFYPDSTLAFAIDKSELIAYQDMRGYEGGNTWKFNTTEGTLDLTPTTTGTDSIIGITPSAALAAASTWRGIDINAGALDPAAGTASVIEGLYVDMSGIDSIDANTTIYGFHYIGCPVETHDAIYHYMVEMTADKVQTGFRSRSASVFSATATYRGIHLDWDGITRDGGAPLLEALKVELPPDYTDFGVSYAGAFSGDGRSVVLCNDTYPLYIEGSGNSVVYNRSLDAESHFQARSFTGFDAAFVLLEHTTARGIYYYDASKNDVKFYNYTSTEGIAFADEGGVIVTGDFYIGTALDDITAPKFVNNSDALEIYSGATPTLAATIDTSQNMTLVGAMTVSTITAGVSDYDKFLVSDSGLVKFRTGAETLSDIGAAPAFIETQYTLPMFATTTTLGDSVISQDSTGDNVSITSGNDAVLTVAILGVGTSKNAGLKIDATEDSFIDFYEGTVFKSNIYWDAGNARLAFNSAGALAYFGAGGIETTGDLTVTGGNIGAGTAPLAGVALTSYDTNTQLIRSNYGKVLWYQDSTVDGNLIWHSWDATYSDYIGIQGHGASTLAGSELWVARNTLLWLTSDVSVFEVDNAGNVQMDGDLTVSGQTVLGTASGVATGLLSIVGGGAVADGSYLTVHGHNHANVGSIHAVLNSATGAPFFRLYDYDGVSAWNSVLEIDNAGFITTYGDASSFTDNDVIAWDTGSSKFIAQAQTGASGGPGTGTQWTLPVWDTTTTLGDSMVSQDAGGTMLTVGGDLTVGGGDVIFTGGGQIRHSTTGGNISVYSSNVWNDGAALQVNDAATGFRFLYDGVEIGSLDSTGDLQIDGDLTVSGGEIQIDGDGGTDGMLDLNPSGTGSQDIIDIYPTAGLVAGSIWKAMYIGMDNLDPATGTTCNIYGMSINSTNVASADGDAVIYGHAFLPSVTENTRMIFHTIQDMTTSGKAQRVMYSGGSPVLSTTSTYQGIYIDWDGVTRDANAPVLQGVIVLLPASYTGFGTSWAALFSGGGESVTLCDGTYSVNTSSHVLIGGNITATGSLTGVTSIAAGGGGFDVDASGNITDCGSIAMGGALTGATTIACSSTLVADGRAYFREGNQSIEIGYTGVTDYDEIHFNDTADSQIMHHQTSGSLYITANGRYSGSWVSSNASYSTWKMVFDTSGDSVYFQYENADTSPEYVTKSSLSSAGTLTLAGHLNFQYALNATTSMVCQIGAATKTSMSTSSFRPYSDHLLDLGTGTEAWDVVYRASEQTTSFVGTFNDPMEDVKNIIWEGGHLDHESLPENIRVLRIKEYEDSEKGFVDKHKQITKADGTKIKGRFTGKIIKKGNTQEGYEFISDEHYDVDGVAMLTLRALQKSIKYTEELEARIVKLENAS